MDEKNENFRRTVVRVAYACAGTCLAIILSVDEQYRIARPWTIGLLSAGFPLAVIAAAAWENNFPARDQLMFPIASITGILIALVGIAAYFLGSDAFGMQGGFAVGMGGVVVIFLAKGGDERKMAKQLISQEERLAD